VTDGGEGRHADIVAGLPSGRAEPVRRGAGNAPRARVPVGRPECDGGAGYGSWGALRWCGKAANGLRIPLRERPTVAVA